jgi:hypothetical protein
VTYPLSEYDDTNDTEASRSHHEWVRQAERRIEEVTGDPATGLLDRTTFRTGQEFDAELRAAGGDPGRGITWGFCTTDSEVVVRDAPESERLDALLHEGLHAWQVEAAGSFIRPPALSEAVTQHLTRVADPAAGVEVGVEELDGRTILLVPELDPDHTEEGVDVTVLASPAPYREGADAVALLEGRIGRDAILEFCRSADHQVMTERVDAECGRGSWARFVDAAERQDWQVARRALGRR